MASQATEQENVHKLEVRLKEKQLAYDAARRDALGAQDTCKLQIEKMKKLAHEKYLFEMET